MKDLKRAIRRAAVHDQIFQRLIFLLKHALDRCPNKMGMIQRRRDDANAGQPLSHQPATLTYQVGLFQPLFQYRQFIVRQAIADLRDRYAGTAMGIAWNVIHPLGMILVYSIVFSGVMAVHTQDRRESLDT